MITIRKSEERGHSDKGWLDSYHTFSFDSYKDQAHMGFHSLRVINDDRVAGGRGFGAHAHRDMEILSYVLEGKLAHKDSMGHGELLGPNEIQRMSAGKGVVHSEFNGSDSDPVHFLQIWIVPKATGSEPEYEQVKFNPEEKRNRFKLLAGPEEASGAVRIRQDARMFVAEITPGTALEHALAAGRAAWVHVIKGSVQVNDRILNAGDAAAVEQERALNLVCLGSEAAEVLLFDLA
jgi:redox-sensitive bicupin YhaK (pirin superfamily)